jgi:hypothetical protein
MQSSRIFHVFHSPRAWATGLAMGSQNTEELLGLQLFIPIHLNRNNILTLQVIGTLTLKKDYVIESVELY